jgi:hypothetical protein
MPTEPDPPVPATGTLATRKRTLDMANDNQQVTVHFVHPTDSTRVLTATVGAASTPDYLINQLVNNDFLAKAGPNSVYKLVDTKTNKELADHVTLAAAGVASNTTLNILANVTGAEPAGAAQ